MTGSGSRSWKRAHWLVVLLVLASVTFASANVRFFLQVMRNLQHYRVTGDQVSMNLDRSEEGNLAFILTLPSRRNNVEEVLMAGYLSAAYAIDRTGLLVKRVYVSAVVVNDRGRTVATTATAEQLTELVAQKITPNKFLGTIEHLN